MKTKKSEKRMAVFRFFPIFADELLHVSKTLINHEYDMNV